MHPRLEETIEQVEQHFCADPRCLGIYLWGSAGKGTADQYSDVDIALVVRDEAFEAVKGELRSICERLCGHVEVWLPEGEQERFCNYAFLFHAGSDLLLYDFSVMTEGFLRERGGSRLDRILHDPRGLLGAAKTDRPVQRYSPDRLPQTIDEYWVYAYLNGKYYQRADVFKLLYVQNCLFQIHLRLLHALRPEAEWGWWPLHIKYLSDEHQEELLVYFGANEPEKIAAALAAELDLFSRDARLACRAWGREYPRALEQAVRRHLHSQGLPIPG
jgi:predicted nucleotidyltransferase